MNFWTFLDRNAFGIFLLVVLFGASAAGSCVGLVHEYRQPPCKCAPGAP